MKKAKASRVPVLENSFRINLPKLRRAVKATEDSRVVLDDGVVRTVAVLAETGLAVFLGGRQWVVEIVPVQCLGDRVRPLLKCPRAHEGNFQSLYYRSGALACRLCHRLRYRSNVVASAADRARIAQVKLLALMGGDISEGIPLRQPYEWRKRYLRLAKKLAYFTSIHYQDLHEKVRDTKTSDGL